MGQQGVKVSRQIETAATEPVQVTVGGPMGFLVQTCASCGRMMTLGEGDMLFGEKWFHGLCWALEADGKG